MLHGRGKKAETTRSRTDAIPRRLDSLLPIYSDGRHAGRCGVGRRGREEGWIPVKQEHVSGGLECECGNGSTALCMCVYMQIHPTALDIRAAYCTPVIPQESCKNRTAVNNL